MIDDITQRRITNLERQNEYLKNKVADLQRKNRKLRKANRKEKPATQHPRNGRWRVGKAFKPGHGRLS